MIRRQPIFFFNDTATTEIYTLSLHDALPISFDRKKLQQDFPTIDAAQDFLIPTQQYFTNDLGVKSEEHTSELQSRETISYAVFCLKKKSIPSSAWNTHYQTEQ